MTPFKKILVPIDFSPFSDEVIATAVDLAKRYDGSVTLQHVYEVILYALPDGSPVFSPFQVAEVKKKLSDGLKAVVEKTVAAGATNIDSQLVEGTPHAAIIGLAEQGNYDLIVMGSHGRTGLQHVLLGSVAERVVRRSPCPVLIVRGTHASTATDAPSPAPAKRS